MPNNMLIATVERTNCSLLVYSHFGEHIAECFIRIFHKVITTTQAKAEKYN